MDRRDVEVGLTGNGANCDEVVADHVDVRHARIGERLEAREVVGPRVAERDELRRA